MKVEPSVSSGLANSLCVGKTPQLGLRTLATIPLLLLMQNSPVRAQSALDGCDPKANDAVRAIAVQSDGKILIGGAFTSLAPNGGAAITRNHIARLNPDGTLDTAFNS